jgi:hypothetical protein
MIPKKKYQRPIVEIVPLDNEISLTLDSSGIPWGDPDLFSISEASGGDLLMPEIL